MYLWTEFFGGGTRFDRCSRLRIPRAGKTLANVQGNAPRCFGSGASTPDEKRGEARWNLKDRSQGRVGIAVGREGPVHQAANPTGGRWGGSGFEMLLTRPLPRKGHTVKQAFLPRVLGGDS